MSIKLTNFGQYCAQLRSRTCRSLAMMAEAIGYDVEYISAIEHGDVEATDTYVERVAEYFSVRFEYLLAKAFPERFLKAKPTYEESRVASLDLPANVVVLDEHRPK